MPALEVWMAAINPDSGGVELVRRGRTSIPIDLSFIPGTTRPVAGDNVGCRVAEVNLKNYAGSFTNVQSGEPIKNLLISGELEIREPNVLVEDNIIDVPYVDVPADDTTIVNGITSWTSRSTAVVRHTTIRCRPENQSFRSGAGLHGSGLDVSRVHIWGMVDGFIMAGVNKRSYAHFSDSLIRDLKKYPYDGNAFLPDGSPQPLHPEGVPSFPGSHDDGTHPDGIQVQGNLTEVSISGNDIGTGGTATILVTQDAGTYDTGVRITKNWFPVDYPTFGSIVNFKLSDPVIANVIIELNRFASQDLARARIILSQAQLDVTQISSDGEGRNIWLEEEGVTVPTTNVPVFRGPGVSPSNLYTYGTN